MDTKPAAGHRIHFTKIVAQVPVLLVGEGGRHAFVVSTDAAIRIGYSGTAGMTIPANQGFTDNYSTDEYWAYAASSSGTVTGFIVI